jgi:site-specific recombinase XerD
MKTTDWERAERRMLLSIGDPVPAGSKPLDEAIADYLADCTARNIRETTITSYDNTLTVLSTALGPSTPVAHISLEKLTMYRQGRKLAASSQRKELEHLRNFFTFCLDREWTPRNPARKLKPPRETAQPTLPFDREEVTKILAACGQITNKNVPAAEQARRRARAMILLMLYSGLRISDVAALERSKLNSKTGQLFLRTAKTGAHVHVRVPKSVIEALATLPGQRYFFWSGNGKPSSIIGSLRRTIDCVLKLAGIKGHPHRFRDTFAVDLLGKDVPIRTVQLLLGHSSLSTTEKHYAPWIKSHQRLLDDATAVLDFGESSSTPT